MKSGMLRDTLDLRTAWVAMVEKCQISSQEAIFWYNMVPKTG